MANPNPSPATRFKPGNRANPGGRRKTLSLVADLRDELEKMAQGSSVSNKQMVVSRLLNQALAGDMQAIKLIFEYVDGKPVQPIDVRREAERIATQYGVDPAKVIVLAEKLKQQRTG